VKTAAAVAEKVKRDEGTGAKKFLKKKRGKLPPCGRVPKDAKVARKEGGREKENILQLEEGEQGKSSSVAPSHTPRGAEKHDAWYGRK